MRACLLLAAAIAASGYAPGAFAQEAETPAQTEAGAKVYARNCSPCHGARMRDPEGAFDLRKFPKDARERFVTSVTNGKGQMPPWNGLLGADEIESLWSYVRFGEK